MIKKLFVMFVILFAVFTNLSAQSSADYFDKLAEKLLDNFEYKGSTVAVKLFNSDLSMQERKKISKSTQLALYCTEDIEIVTNAEDADYICSGNIETDGPNYIVSVKLVDNYDGSTVAKARQKVPKNYYAEKVENTIIVENDIDAEDVLGAVIFGSVIGAVFHALTEPHHHAPVPHPHPVPRPHHAPNHRPRPNRP